LARHWRAVLRLRSGDVGLGSSDFVAARAPNAQPYLVSVCPLLAASASGPASPHAVAIVFVRDPLARQPAAAGALRELFGLTEAEAGLAQALQAGVALNEYAERRSLSLNTVYTHLRRLREKTGCNRMSELIHKPQRAAPAAAPHREMTCHDHVPVNATIT
jgi:DNA-binding CsgD family transcriptional regulator